MKTLPSHKIPAMIARTSYINLKHNIKFAE